MFYVHIHKTHLSTHVASDALVGKKYIYFSFLFNLICAFLGHVAFVLTLDKNPPLMEDTC